MFFLKGWSRGLTERAGHFLYPRFEVIWKLLAMLCYQEGVGMNLDLWNNAGPLRLNAVCKACNFVFLGGKRAGIICEMEMEGGCCWSVPVFLSMSSTDIWGHVILHGGSLSCAFAMFSTILGLYPLQVRPLRAFPTPRYCDNQTLSPDFTKLSLGAKLPLGENQRSVPCCENMSG